mmetsp:Transcript_5750/g.9143  ORF Transcript_5750/g.9143 Transcript_5750/m.9143 type:complete len:222 (-) Transcript_5750:1403-2068(-)
MAGDMGGRTHVDHEVVHFVGRAVFEILVGAHHALLALGVALAAVLLALSCFLLVTYQLLLLVLVEVNDAALGVVVRRGNIGRVAGRFDSLAVLGRVLLQVLLRLSLVLSNLGLLVLVHYLIFLARRRGLGVLLGLLGLELGRILLVFLRIPILLGCWLCFEDDVLLAVSAGGFLVLGLSLALADDFRVVLLVRLILVLDDLARFVLVLTAVGRLSPLLAFH